MGRPPSMSTIRTNIDTSPGDSGLQEMAAVGGSGGETIPREDVGGQPGLCKPFCYKR